MKLYCKNSPPHKMLSLIIKGTTNQAGSASSSGCSACSPIHCRIKITPTYRETENFSNCTSSQFFLLLKIYRLKHNFLGKAC